MKVRFEIDCTPLEARGFLGLPDVTALNDHLTAEMKRRLDANVSMLEARDADEDLDGAGRPGAGAVRQADVGGGLRRRRARARGAVSAGADTIFALATPPGRSAVAVVRLSGEASAAVLRALTGRAPPPPRRASLRRLRDGGGGVLDEALVLWTPGPGSYTGEDAAELHLHGGAAVTSAVLQALADAGLRPARPGEFTRRAFANGRMDLLEAEGVADLVDAETEAQRRQALAQLGGALAARQARWRGWLLEAAAQLAAAVDFPDEDLPAEVAARAGPPLLQLRADLAQAAGDSRGLRVRDGFRIALLGAPNAGKSSLLNGLSGRDAAIVTPVPGTTRDVVEVVMELAGRRVVLADTAGLRDTDDPIEAEGRAPRPRLGRLGRPAPVGGRARGRGRAAARSRRRRPARGQQGRPRARRRPRRPSRPSVAAPGGLDALRAELTARVISGTGGDAPPVVTRARHRESLHAALAEIDRALATAAHAPELAAESVRMAGRALGALTGEVDPEAVLDRVFSAFCIGK